MSQAKVDQYKEYKQNRKANLEKEKKNKQRHALIGKIVTGVIALALVVALGITAYNVISNRIQARPDYAREELVISDVAGALVKDTTAAPTTEPESAQESESASEGETEAESKTE